VSEFHEVPRYSSIALDVAQRVARGELKENTKLYGRSVMSSEYGVSPETVRRAMKLLADMEVVSNLRSSGTMILSAEKAQNYVEKYVGQIEIRSRQQKLHQLILQQEELGRQISDLAESIVRINQRFAYNAPTMHHEALVEEGCPIVWKSLGELQFRQRTGATVIAVRRGTQTIISPGADTVLKPGDTLLFVGGDDVAASLQSLLSQKS